MTQNEAIEILNNTPLMRYERIYEKNLGHKSQVGTALSMAIEALEKQISKKEAVNHPSHYQAPGRKECIVEMLELFGKEKVITFCELNAYKYHYRHELKNGQEDLDKAEWYEEFAEKLKGE